MRRLSTDTWIAIALLLLLVAVTIAAGAQQTRDSQIPALSNKSNEPAGARATGRTICIALRERCPPLLDQGLEALEIELPRGDL